MPLEPALEGSRNLTLLLLLTIRAETDICIAAAVVALVCKVCSRTFIGNTAKYQQFLSRRLTLSISMKQPCIDINHLRSLFDAGARDISC
jgi:hypothetical protein